MGFYTVCFLFYLFFLSVSLFPLFNFSMQRLRVGSLNINGGRDRQRRALVSELVNQKSLDIIFLQETHSDTGNEVDWGLWWRGQYFLSHGTNNSKGIAILFSPGVTVNVISHTEIVTGRVQMVRAEIGEVVFCFINVYASNQVLERLDIFKKLKEVLQQCGQGECVVMGGDWNCTVNFEMDKAV